jgi:hypothetical protein
MREGQLEGGRVHKLRRQQLVRMLVLWRQQQQQEV